MRIVVSAEGTDLDARANTTFGRCPAFVFVDTDTMACEALENPAAGAAGGAGVRAAQLVVEKGARAVVSGAVGPQAAQVLEAAGVPVYQLREPGTVREAVGALLAGRLSTAGQGSQATSARRQKEIAGLETALVGLRRRLAGIVAQLERLERRS